jgi:hypothetical protein
MAMSRQSSILFSARSALLAGTAIFSSTLMSEQAQAACNSTPLICAAVTGGAAVADLNTSVAIDFYTFSSPFVTSSPGSSPSNTTDTGAWIRGVYGEGTRTSNFSSNGAFGPFNSNPSTRTTYGGFQGGIDGGLINLGNTGWTTHFGVTFGYAEATPSLAPGTGSASYSVPFMGFYGVFAKDNFVALLQVRHGWDRASLDNPALAVVGATGSATGLDISSMVAYRINFGQFFLEPNAGFDWVTTSDITPQALNPGVPGVLYASTITNSLGNVGARIGGTFTTGSLAIQPYLSASVWRDFDGVINSRFVTAIGTQNVQISGIGTFGQFGAGVAAQVLNTGWVGYLRADYRTGSSYESWVLNGGVRYTW